MRAGLIVNSLAGGGAERQAAIWAAVCAASGYEVRVLAMHEQEASFDLPPDARIDYAHKRGAGDVPRLVAIVRTWARKADVIATFQPYPAVLCWAARVPTPTIVVTGDDPRHHWRDPDHHRFPVGVLRRALAYATAGSAPAPGLADVYEALGVRPRHGWFTIPNIVGPEAFIPHRSDGAGALFVGRLEAQKDPLMAVEAATRAGLPLTILGHGSLEQDIRAAVRSTPGASVSLMPYTSAPWEVYAGHRVLVLTSQYEPFGNVIIESLAAGTPVVAVDCDFGPRTILAGSRFSAVVPRSPAAVAAGLRAAAGRPYTDYERGECRRIARRYAVEAVSPSITKALEFVAAAPHGSTRRRARSGSRSPTGNEPTSVP
jgi:glycosyltransferase involved in cell wall biosynthesis